MVATVDSPSQVNAVTMPNADSLDALDLPHTWSTRIRKTVKDNKLEWELIMETANSYQELKKDLRGRGYRNVPSNFNASIPMQKMMPRRPKANTKNLPQQKTMLRKKR